MCDQELDDCSSYKSSSSGLSLTSSAELCLSSDTELGDVESNPEATEPQIVIV